MASLARCLAAAGVAALALGGAYAVQQDEERAANVAHMHAHLSRCESIRDAVVHGDLEAGREAARWLAEHEPPAPAAAYPDQFEAMRKAARRIATASNSVAAAHGAATLGHRCGACHVAAGVRVVLDPPPPPVGGRPDMAAHAWAAERMWQGLVAPSDTAWNEGVDALLDAPLQTADFTPTERLSMAELRFLIRLVHMTGSRGLATKDAEARAQLYGEYLSLCADCHRGLREAPPSD